MISIYMFSNLGINLFINVYIYLYIFIYIYLYIYIGCVDESVHALFSWEPNYFSSSNTLLPI